MSEGFAGKGPGGETMIKFFNLDTNCIQSKCCEYYRERFFTPFISIALAATGRNIDQFLLIFKYFLPHNWTQSDLTVPFFKMVIILFRVPSAAGAWFISLIVKKLSSTSTSNTKNIINWESVFQFFFQTLYIVPWYLYLHVLCRCPPHNINPSVPTFLEAC